MVCYGCSWLHRPMSLPPNCRRSWRPIRKFFLCCVWRLILARRSREGRPVHRQPTGRALSQRCCWRPIHPAGGSNGQHAWECTGCNSHECVVGRSCSAIALSPGQGRKPTCTDWSDRRVYRTSTTRDASNQWLLWAPRPVHAAERLLSLGKPISLCLLQPKINAPGAYRRAARAAAPRKAIVLRPPPSLLVRQQVRSSFR
jgi:hypothetical protein